MDRPSTPPSAAHQVSFHRVQLLLVSVVLSLMLLHEILFRIAWKGGAAILQVNQSPVAVFAASAAVYVAGELHRALKQ